MENKVLLKFIILVVGFVALLTYILISNECPEKGYCLHSDDGDGIIFIFGIVVYTSVLFYEIVQILIRPLKKVVNKVAHRVKMWDFRNGGTDKKDIEIVQYVPPEGINSAEAGLLLHRYASTTDMISLLYKREYENIISIKTEQSQGKECIVIAKKEKMGIFSPEYGKHFLFCPEYEKHFFFNLFQNGDVLKLGEWSELSKMCNLTELENYGINQQWFVKPRFSVSFNLFFYLMGVVLVIMTMCGGGLDLVYILGIMIFLTIIEILFSSIGFFVVCFFASLKKKIVGYICTTFMVLIIAVCSSYFLSSIDENLLSNIFIARFISFVIGMIYLRKKPQKLKLTKKGNLLKKHLLGFRKFILTCDEGKINSFLKRDPLFYDKIIPYAVVFGVETDLLKKLIPIFDDKIDPRDGNYKSRKALGKF